MSELPTPRLQFRWVPLKHESGANWMCFYEFVFGLRNNDIRRGARNKKTEMRLVIGRTRITADKIAADYVPFRDGAHARWDRAQFGNPPVFSVRGDDATRITDIEEWEEQKCNS